MSQSQPTSTVLITRRLAAYLRPYWPLQAGAVVASLVAVATLLPLPLLMKVLIDEVAGAGELDLLPPVLLGIMLLALITMVAEVAGDYLFTTAGEQAINDIRSALMTHTLRLPLAYFRRRRTGEVVTHFTSDSVAVSGAYRQAFGEGVASAIQLTAILAFIALIDWRFGLVALGLAPIYMLVPTLRQRHHLRAGRRVQDATGTLSGLATELVAGARDIKAFSQEGWARRRLRAALRDVFGARVYDAFVRGAYTLSTAIFWFVYAAIFAVMAGPILEGQTTLGFVLAMASYFTSLDFTMRTLMAAYVDLQHSIGAASRLFEFLQTPEESVDRAAGEPLSVGSGGIKFERVSASYEIGPPVLHEVDFIAPGGRTTALVGPSGAGKTTVVQLLMRFLQPSAGRITIDGHDIAAASAAAVRRHVGVVFQDPVLFDGSVADNIQFGRTEVDDDRVVVAAKIANADDFIQVMPDGYETHVGERGLHLSGGQAQRIAIARAIAANPRILVLDEALAAQDAESERLVQQSLERARRGRTTIVIAHRLATVRKADQIVVLDEGRVVDCGHHDELYVRCDLYRHLCNLQMTQAGEAT